MKAGMKEQPGCSCVLIRGGHLYAPEEQGARDVLLSAGRIALVRDHIDVACALGVDVIDASNMIVAPGFVDLHVHVTGGGGEAGPVSRVPEITLSALTEAGITSVVGLLGTDSVSRHPETLLMKIKALRMEGLSAFMFTGSYHVPPCAICGSVKHDITLIDEVIGVKIAMSDHRGSQLDVGELARLASEARVGGILSGKPGLVNVHVGSGSQGLMPLVKVVEQTEIPIRQFLPTHIARSPALLQQGIDWVAKGGYIDITATEDESKADWILGELSDSGVELGNVTFSSDGNGSKPKFDEGGRLVGMSTGKVSSLIKLIRLFVKAQKIPLGSVLRFVTSNPADRIGMSERKGRIREGGDADVLILHGDLSIDKVFAKGRLMVDAGKPVVKGTFE